MRGKAKRLLVVDDEASIQRILSRTLGANGYDVLVAANAKQAIEMVHRYQPDLILLDLCMPGELNGLDVCARVRAVTHIPIIILSAVTEEKQKVRALDLGADDYLTKPFGNKELQARVRACLRRTCVTESKKEQEVALLVSEDEYLYMDVARRQVCVGSQEVRLTPIEFALLQQLMLYAGKVLTHRVLLRAVWGPEYSNEGDYLRVYIRQLRLKLEVEPSRPQYIVTEPGIGYVFRANVKIRDT